MRYLEITRVAGRRQQNQNQRHPIANPAFPIRVWIHDPSKRERQGVLTRRQPRWVIASIRLRQSSAPASRPMAPAGSVSVRRYIEPVRLYAHSPAQASRSALIRRLNRTSGIESQAAAIGAFSLPLDRTDGHSRYRSIDLLAGQDGRARASCIQPGALRAQAAVQAGMARDSR